MRLPLLILAAVLAAGATAVAQPLDALPKAKAPPRWDYSKLNKLPDWRGIWLPARGGAKPVDTAAPPLTPEYQKRFDDYAKLSAEGRASSHGRTVSNCMPPGMPRIMSQPYNVEFTFLPDRVVIIQEAYMQVRRVWTDGRRHPDDPDPTFNGHSIGHWEGDTLVVETVGLRDDTWMGPTGAFHSEKLQITERIHLDPADPDRLIEEFTFVDPDALTRPWKQANYFKRSREWDQLEFVCAENDRNPVSDTGATETLVGSDNLRK